MTIDRRTIKLSIHEVRCLAVEACVDPRTAQKWLKGEKNMASTNVAVLERAWNKLYPKFVLDATSREQFTGSSKGTSDTNPLDDTLDNDSAKKTDKTDV